LAPDSAWREKRSQTVRGASVVPASQRQIVQLAVSNLFEGRGLPGDVWLRPADVERLGGTLIKAFVQEAVEHSFRLEKALTRLTMDKRIVLLHYSPIRDTVAGENPELFPFLGASRFEATIDQFKVSAVFHGHAHHGTLEGKTAKQVPVFNVALPVLSRSNGRKFLFYEV